MTKLLIRLEHPLGAWTEKYDLPGSESSAIDPDAVFEIVRRRAKLIPGRKEVRQIADLGFIINIIESETNQTIFIDEGKSQPEAVSDASMPTR